VTISGGHFEYKQYHLNEIADSIHNEIEMSGKRISDKDLTFNKEYYEKYPDERYYYKYPKNILKKFKEAVKALEKAAVYVQRVDWLLSGDDGEESF